MKINLPTGWGPKLYKEALFAKSQKRLGVKIDGFSPFGVAPEHPKHEPAMPRKLITRPFPYTTCVSAWTKVNKANCKYRTDTRLWLECFSSQELLNLLLNIGYIPKKDKSPDPRMAFHQSF